MGKARREILEVIHLAVRTEFFNKYRKNMEFLADDIEKIIRQEKIDLIDSMIGDFIVLAVDLPDAKQSLGAKIKTVLDKHRTMLDNPKEDK